MLQTDSIFQTLLTPFIKNQKYYKRKYTKDLKDIISSLNLAIGNIETSEKESFFNNILHRR